MKSRTWRWRTTANPWRPARDQCKALKIAAAKKIPHPLAARHGQVAREVCRGRNGNALFEFEDGFRTVAPWRAVL